MPFELSIAFKYLKSRRHGLFALITTMIAIGGVSIGVAALIVTLSVMNGFRSDIQTKTLGIQPHIVLMGTEKDPPLVLESLSDKLESLEEVESAAPFIYGQILVKSQHQTQGVVIRGIIPKKEFQVTSLEKSIVSGSWQSLESGDQKSIILGRELFQNLGVTLGSDIIVISPDESTAMGIVSSVPRMERLTVTGVFQSGMYEFDANMAVTSYQTAQQLFSLSGASGLGIRTKNLEKAESIAKKIGAVSGAKYWVRSWQSMNRNLFEALKLEKIVMAIILTMIILVASFTIISNLILMSIEKSRDIGILRALGASKGSIQKIFLFAGSALGTTGTILGTFFGVLIVIVLDKTKWIRLPQDVYYIDTLPVQLSTMDITMVVLGAFCLTIVSAMYPAKQAAKMNPLDAIRYG